VGRGCVGNGVSGGQGGREGETMSGVHPKLAIVCTVYCCTCMCTDYGVLVLCTCRSRRYERNVVHTTDLARKTRGRGKGQVFFSPPYLYKLGTTYTYQSNG
jgi:hypothetical protein